MSDPEILNKVLLDPKLSHKEAQHLLNMICNPKLIATNALPENEIDQKQTIAKHLQNLEEWTIRVSWLQLQLMFAQCSQTSSTEVSTWLDNVAKATVDFFQNASEEVNKQMVGAGMFSPKRGVKGHPIAKQQIPDNSVSSNKDKVWLIAPLISKLHSSVQGKILKVAANVLETGNWMSTGVSQTVQYSSSSKSKDRGFQQQKNVSSSSVSSSLLSYQPFLSLVLMCLKGQDEQRETLLNSLYNQLLQAVHEKLSEDVRVKQSIQEGLQLRLSLVGGMFDMIQRSSNLINDWAVLFLQLISCSVVDPQFNYELFTTVLDMLAVLMHTTQVSDSSDRSETREESKKQYQNLIKKLKKELAANDRNTIGIRMIQQLLPIPKQQCDVITCEPMGSLIDTKGNKIAGFDSIDKKQGLQVAEKQKVSPWDLLEGHKNPAPLSWSWFGAIRIERRPLRCDEKHRLLGRHSHKMVEPTEYYLEPPPLPPEDVVEPPPPAVPSTERVGMFPVQQHPMQTTLPGIDDIVRRDPVVEASSPRAIAPKKPKVQRQRRQRQTKNVIASSPQTTAIRMPNYDNYSNAPPPQTANWYNQPAGVPPQASTGNMPQTYFAGQQPMNQRSAPAGHSKAALRNMLGNRHPTTPQYNLPQNTTPNVGPSMVVQPGPTQNVYQARQMMMRPQQPMGGQMPMNAPPPNNMYQMQNIQTGPSGQIQGGNMAPAPIHHLPVQSQANYGNAPPNMNYNNSMPIQAMEQPIPGPPANQYHQQQNPMMNQMRMQQSQIPPQQPQQFAMQRYISFSSSFF